MAPREQNKPDSLRMSAQDAQDVVQRVQDSIRMSMSGSDMDFDGVSHAGTSIFGADEHSSKKEALADSLARKETYAVCGLRMFMFGVLLVVAVVCSFLICTYTKRSEEQEFESEFTAQGLKFIGGFQGDSLRKLQALEALSRSITACTLESGSEWPFVTIPDSANHFQPYLSLADAASLLVMPIVPARLRSAWERYSIANQGWIDQDLEAQKQALELLDLPEEASAGNNATRRLADAYRSYEQDLHLDNYGRQLQINSDTLKQVEEGTVSWYIKNYVGIDTSPGNWVVWWQHAPVLPNRWFINFNRMAVPGFDKEVQAVTRKSAVVSSTWTFDRGVDFQSTRDLAFNANLLKARGNGGNYEPGEPVACIHYPIFDTYD